MGVAFSMRFAAPFLLSLAIAGPAAAQACEASVIGKVGEVVAARSGAGKPALVTWAVERREGVGEESDHFARPGLMLDFTIAADGALVPARAMAPVTRYSDTELGRAPAMSEVQVRAIAAGAGAISWRGDDPAKGEAALVKQLREAWPQELVIEVVTRGEVQASATFDLSALSEVRAMALQALNKCGQ